MRWSTPRATGPAVLALLLPFAAAPTTFADDVYLENGQSFTNVAVEESPGRVTIRLMEGSLTLPLSQVERIERKASPYQDFLARRAGLHERKATATEWVELADWALRSDLRLGARDAALTAAALDPGASGLAPVMARLDYVWDEAGARWMTHDEKMRRKGFVLTANGWISREEHARQEGVRAELERERRARRQERERELAELETLASLRRARSTRELRDAALAGAAPLVQVNVLVPGFYFPAPVFVGPTPIPVPAPAGRPEPGATPGRGPLLDAFERQPGSLIPGILDLDRGGS